MSTQFTQADYWGVLASIRRHGTSEGYLDAPLAFHVPARMVEQDSEPSDRPQRAYKTTCIECDETISMTYPFCPWCSIEQ